MLRNAEIYSRPAIPMTVDNVLTLPVSRSNVLFSAFDKRTPDAGPAPHRSPSASGDRASRAAHEAEGEGCAPCAPAGRARQNTQVRRAVNPAGSPSQPNHEAQVEDCVPCARRSSASDHLT